MADIKTRLVIFDFDGVLVNSEVIALAELRDSLSEKGIHLEVPELIEMFLGSSFEDISAFVHRQTGRQPDSTFRENWYARLFKRYRPELTIMPDALELLDRLDALGVSYCIASGGSYRRLNFALDVTGLAGRFTNSAFSADSVAKGKPAPDLFLHAAASLSIPTHACLVIEDAVSGTSAAAAAGIPSLGFVGGGHLTDCREAHSQRLRDAGAAAVINELGQVIAHL